MPSHSVRVRRNYQPKSWHGWQISSYWGDTRSIGVSFSPHGVDLCCWKYCLLWRRRDHR